MDQWMLGINFSTGLLKQPSFEFQGNQHGNRIVEHKCIVSSLSICLKSQFEDLAPLTLQPQKRSIIFHWLLQRLQNLSHKGHRSIVHVESWSWPWWLLHVVAGVSAAYLHCMSTHISSIQSHDSIWTLVCCLCFEELLEPQWSIGHGHIPQCTTSKHPGNRHLEKKKLNTLLRVIPTMTFQNSLLTPLLSEAFVTGLLPN
jgi:hypothetical protein